MTVLGNFQPGDPVVVRLPRPCGRPEVVREQTERLLRSEWGRPEAVRQLLRAMEEVA